MKPPPLGVMLLAICVFIPPATFAQKPDFNEPIAKYDLSKEATFKGVVAELAYRVCPIGGDMRFHLLLKIDNETYEVHVASIKFMKIYKATFHKGDTVEVIGFKTRFQGVDAILPREIKHAEDTRLFRDENGKPIWQ